jgi:hypothetical protein
MSWVILVFICGVSIWAPLYMAHWQSRRPIVVERQRQAALAAERRRHPEYVLADDTTYSLFDVVTEAEWLVEKRENNGKWTCGKCGYKQDYDRTYCWSARCTGTRHQRVRPELSFTLPTVRPARAFESPEVTEASIRAVLTARRLRGDDLRALADIIRHYPKE